MYQKYLFFVQLKPSEFVQIRNSNLRIPNLLNLELTNLLCVHLWVHMCQTHAIPKQSIIVVVDKLLYEESNKALDMIIFI